MTRPTDSAGGLPSPPRPGRTARRVWSVLIVDPDRDGAQHLAAALAPNIVAVVDSARAAFEAIQAKPPDLVVTELDLPDMPGIELIGRLRSAPATRHVLLLVTTRRTAVRDKVAAFQAGADDYLVKPLDAQQFVAHAELVSRFLQVTGRGPVAGSPARPATPDT